MVWQEKMSARREGECLGGGHGEKCTCFAGVVLGVGVGGRVVESSDDAGVGTIHKHGGGVAVQRG